MTMKADNSGKIILSLSLPMAALIVVTSFIGIFTPDFYYKETLNWQAQSIGQDMINLFIVMPFLLITSVLAYKKISSAESLWAGSLLYLIYTYLIYCFSVHFNSLFIIYCIILGFAFYSLMYFIYICKNTSANFVHRRLIAKITGVYFIVIACMFYFLWLSEVIPAIIHNAMPQSLVDTGLYTNPVHVIDLAVFLPGLFITGFLLLKKQRVGYIVTPLILVFFILMDVTIGFLTVIMKMRGLEGEIFLTIIMSALAIFSTVLLILFFKKPELADTQL